ncbi:hypothetical protein SD53_04710 [Rheinheimera mesophila]|nr:hypothetical protein SD53_04710 [Rheinheimera mesophila]
MSMEGRYVATVGNSVATMSMEGRYVATVGVIAVFRHANNLAFRRYHAFASGEGRAFVATMSMEGRHVLILMVRPILLLSFSLFFSELLL